MKRRLTALMIAASAVSCASDEIAVPDDVVWQVDDKRPIEKAPEENWSALAWDGADKTVFRPITRALLVDVHGPAKNVNALGEVPNSSWYSNRMALTQLSPERVVRGPCDEPIDQDAEWIVTGGKIGGANPGFQIEDTTDGRTYLLKFDTADQPERATAADTIGSKVFWAAGFSTPCNSVVHFDVDNLKIGDDATKEDELGRETSLTMEDVEAALEGAPRRADGRVRGSSSLFLPGKPLGPFRYHGVRFDDPNDTIPHEDRRELRGSKLISAWINHFDSRGQNTFTSFIEGEDGGGYVQHHILDWGDSLGSLWGSDQMSRRFGFSSYFDPAHVFTDLLTFAAIVRPWEKVVKHPDKGPMFGYFGTEEFDPKRWKPGYPNPAYSRMDAVDAYWGAKIVSRFSNEHVWALVQAGEFTNETHATFLYRVLVERRDRIVRAYMRDVTPFDDPRFVDDSLCVDDMLVKGGYASTADALYEMSIDEWTWTQNPGVSTDGELCISLEDAERKRIDLRVTRTDQERPAPAVTFIVVRDGGEPELRRVVRRGPDDRM